LLGFIGFNNEIKDNGYLDVTLESTLQVGRQFFTLENRRNKQRTFNTSLELPYLFKANWTKGELNIFKQDSTFQNTKLRHQLFSKLHTRYLGYQSTVSNDLQNTGAP
jgi:hypothetical protein